MGDARGYRAVGGRRHDLEPSATAATLSTRPSARCARVSPEARCGLVAQQIAGWLQRTYPQDLAMQVSHETTYRSLFVQSRGVLRHELLRHLRRRKTMRRSQVGSAPPPSRAGSSRM